jgi:hypothetical protein
MQTHRRVTIDFHQVRTFDIVRDGLWFFKFVIDRRESCEKVSLPIANMILISRTDHISMACDLTCEPLYWTSDLINFTVARSDEIVRHIQRYQHLKQTMPVRL